MASFKVLSRHLAGGTEKNLNPNSRSPGRNLHQRVPEYEAGMLTTLPRRSLVH
jgi:hypothetical protein